MIMKKFTLIFLNTIFMLGGMLYHATAIPVTYTVNNNAGGSSGTYNPATGIGSGTFEHAITTVNASTDPGPHQINITVPSITLGWITGGVVLNKGNVTINGNFSGCDPATLIDFGGINFTVNNVNNVTIKGIKLVGTHLILTGGGNHKVFGCWFNLNNAGTAAQGTPLISQISITNSTNCRIGGVLNCQQRNVISGGANHWQATIAVSSNSHNTIIAGNYIGLDKTGTVVLSNVTNDAGIGINGCQSVRIDSNVVAGFTAAAIYGTGNLTNLQLNENFIGLSATGLANATDYGSKYPGVHLENTSGNNISIRKNVVCDNGNNNGGGETDCGILIKGNGLNGLDISENHVGIDRNFNKKGNSFAGIYVLNNVTNCTIRQNYVGDNGNGHGSNKSHGIATRNITTGPLYIYGNYVGVTPSGTDIGNWANGIEINQTQNFTIGGSGANQRNFIGYNKGANPTGNAANAGGILITVSSSNGTIQNNIITYQQNFGAGRSANHGIVVENGSNRIRIGGHSNNHLNVIAHNGTDGILVGGTATADYVHVLTNSIYCNNGSMGEGIQLNSTPQHGNNNHPAPNIIPAQTAPSPGYLNRVTGTATANDSVYIYTTVQCTNTCPKQGETLLAKVRANGSGNWSYTHSSTIYNKISAYAISTSACNGGFCRTSEFSTCIDNPLPIVLLSFEATLRNGNTAVLNWKTSMEKNNAYFIIEKSTDGQTFQPIGRVEGNNESSTTLSYLFTDGQALESTTYYRLKQVDFDGTFAYSKTIYLSPAQALSMHLFPNPAQGEVAVVLNGLHHSATFSISLLNNLGVEVYKRSGTSEESVYEEILPLYTLAPGIYYVTFRSGEEYQTKKLMVQ
jgi:hypothetical protein